MKWPDLPKPVNIAIAVIGGSLMLFIILLFTLGSVAEDTITVVSRLRNEVAQIQKNEKTAKEDYDFIVANRERFDRLMQSDKLIPHTRRTAVRQLQAHALEFGMSDLTFNFQAVGAQTPEQVASQPKAGDYRVFVENIELKIGAPLDQNVYSFIAAVHDEFPGTMVLTRVALDRAPAITPEALNKVSRGEDSGLVKGTISYSWRTAQKNDDDKKKEAPRK